MREGFPKVIEYDGFTARNGGEVSKRSEGEEGSTKLRRRRASGDSRIVSFVVERDWEAEEGDSIFS